MPKPVYPTKEGLWSKGTRPEGSYKDVRLGTPYPEAVENFRRAVEGREDFDPAVLFVWGTMQATAVLSVLKAAEETFGQAGQDMVRQAIQKAGYEAMKGLMETSEFPEDLTESEYRSFLVTGLNTVLYASLERPWITDENRCEFDILWCPHQDRYTAFDCRVQRYFVEGMIQAGQEGRNSKFTAAVQKLIPRGAECCHFVVDRIDPQEEANPWNKYSDELGRRAFEKMYEQKKPE